MLTGKRFRLERPTLAVDSRGDQPSSVTIPLGAVIKIVSDANGVVDVLWDGKLVEMLAVEVDVRGPEVVD